MRLTLILLGLSACCAFANIRLPKLLGSNMVLQRDKVITIWGWGDVGEKVTVQFNKQIKTTKADKLGKWSLNLDAEAAGGPFTMILKGKNTIILKNILVGEVWVCSGQSNMEWPVSAAANATEEIKNAKYPMIRHFTVQKSIASLPQEEVNGGDWQVCSPETVGDFTAVGFFFAREVFQKTNIPIGLVHTSWGATHSETWTSRDALANSDEYKDVIAKMPTLDLVATARKKNEDLSKRLAVMNISLGAENRMDWASKQLDDSGWPTLGVPELWERKLGEVDGVIWYRKTVNIDREDAGKAATLQLSMIDDWDITYVNGLNIGATDAHNVERSYSIPEKVLVAGDNIVAVRVTNAGGNGGIYGEAEKIKLVTSSGKSIALAGDWKFYVENLQVSRYIGPNTYPSLLYNAMLHPILNYSIRGVLWYQGEGNTERSYQYRKAFPLMIQDWRKGFKQGDFPFYFVQLAGFNAGNDEAHGSKWAELREAQTMTLSLPNTGMAVTTDISEANNIHPRNKQDVGKRLAALALNRLYNKSVTDSGPMYLSKKLENRNIRITFTNVGAGLMVRDKYGYLKGFEVAGIDHEFYYAKAWLEGNEVVVSSDVVTEPVEVRFAWADNPEDANLFNKNGFPAVPFRTDMWRGITEGNRFTIEH